MSEPSQHPHLEAVRAEDPEAGTPLAEPVEAASPRGRSMILAILCIALVVCLFLLIGQARQTGQLQEEIVRVGEQLGAAQAAVAAAEAELARHEARMAEVRGVVGELQQRVDALARLVEDAPSSESGVTPAAD